MTAGMTRLWLIRHAPVDGPRGVIHGPDAPADVSDAEAFAALRRQLPPAAVSVCSPARRTRETAAGLGLAPQIVSSFREQDFGAWTGRRHDDLAAETGDAYRAFWDASAHNRPPGGESFVDQIARVAEGIAALPDGDVVLVVHSGTVRAALAVALDLAPEHALRFVIDPLSLTRIDRIQPGWRVVAVNRLTLGRG
ncbi:histidine phosphatase family protein [Bradyrhizobium sp. U87765 SZCCT0131]|nr:histidine phosphatase family protein [Bradyrhizobium sp. U87765 SZCCT0131]MBR1264940.1 histidine phosphatase family protein [Bradyrhizobium sp. U87765 SZCCT0134]MBR1304922.1 histidine phosphatase family protein [Bradyrhizobium sp. U87765 SZCCT0110]MBR1320708.1 histidine phosphatase family protein [Bradyrhizobium sp. U87765 SZCCT0109]MBR1349128.1 histidine phosphatase family protein [Bradyrhizobium sp. U87765 SZCCT0048]